MGSEQEARKSIDRLLAAAGWAVQDFRAADIHGARGVVIRAHASGRVRGGTTGAEAAVSIHRKESNHTTWRLADMNLAIRGIDYGQIAQGGTFHNERYPVLKADFMLASPSFSITDWGGKRLRNEKRWQHGTPPVSNANAAWVQHIVRHLAPVGVADFVPANGSMSTRLTDVGARPQEMQLEFE